MARVTKALTLDVSEALAFIDRYVATHGTPPASCSKKQAWLKDEAQRRFVVVEDD